VPPLALRDTLREMMNLESFRMKDLKTANDTQRYAVRAWLIEVKKALKEAGRGRVQVVNEDLLRGLIREIEA
jgi:hypothetical protein